MLTVRLASFFPDFMGTLSHAFLVLHCFPQDPGISPRFYPGGDYHAAGIKATRFLSP
jgi:hypothetical protein